MIVEVLLKPMERAYIVLSWIQTQAIIVIMIGKIEKKSGAPIHITVRNI